MTFTPISWYNNSILFKWGMFPDLIVMQEIPMTAKEMLAAYVKAAEKKEVEDYVNEVLADMSEEDLYCNFLTEQGPERSTETEEGDLIEV